MADHNAIVAKILQALEDVRKAVTTGDYQSLGPLCELQNWHISTLLSRQHLRDVMTVADARKLAAQADQNQRLLQASMAGFRAAGRRKTEISRIKHGLRTYDQSGQPTVLGLGTIKLERRS